MAATVYQAFCESVASWPSHPFLCVLPETADIYGTDAGEITYAQAQARIDTLRQAYQAAGYGHGHRVGLLLDNRPSFFLHWFALNAIGASVVPINADLRAAELEYLIGHSEVALIVALASRHADLAAAAQRAGCRVGLADANDATPAAPSAPPRAGVAPDAHTECALLYTSGTTGRPKGCVLSNRYFLHCGHWYATVGGMAELRPGQERMLTPLPLVHMNAMAYSAMAMMLTGGCLIALDRFHPRSWWQSVRESRATVVHYLGVMPAILMQAPVAEADTRHAVRFGFGAGVDRTLHKPFEDRFGFPLLEAWAMTETGAGAVVMANREPRHVGSHCFGIEGADVQVRLVLDDGSDAGVGEPGELWVRHAGDDPHYGFFTEYLKDAPATREAWAEGWFHTGDIVRRDADGALRFVDRKKNVIRRSGENIAAIEVESVLLQHPQVKAVAVAAVPDAVRGDEVMAVIVPVSMPVNGAARTEAAHALVQWALAELAYYKVPGYVSYQEALPLTATNKIQRGEIKTLAQQLLDTGACVDTRALKKRQGAH